jgi:hypothetical protein
VPVVALLIVHAVGPVARMAVCLALMPTDSQQRDASMRAPTSFPSVGQLQPDSWPPAVGINELNPRGLERGGWPDH